MSDKVDIEAVRARADAATEGPWLIWDGFGPNVHGEMGAARIGPELSHSRAIFAGSHPGEGTISGTAADMEFIAHAREDVPALCAEVERLREVEAAAREFVEAQATKSSLFLYEGTTSRYFDAAKRVSAAAVALEQAVRR
jgi:hypothetical protein